MIWLEGPLTRRLRFDVLGWVSRVVLVLRVEDWRMLQRSCGRLLLRVTVGCCLFIINIPGTRKKRLVRYFLLELRLSVIYHWQCWGHVYIKYSRSSNRKYTEVTRVLKGGCRGLNWKLKLKTSTIETWNRLQWNLTIPILKNDDLDYPPLVGVWFFFSVYVY